MIPAGGAACSSATGRQAAAAATVAMAASPLPSQPCFRLTLEVISLGYLEMGQWLHTSNWMMPEEAVPNPPTPAQGVAGVAHHLKWDPIRVQALEL